MQRLSIELREQIKSRFLNGEKARDIAKSLNVYPSTVFRIMKKFGLDPQEFHRQIKLNKKTKICSKCKKELDFNQFFKDKHALDGLTFRCKRCQGTRTEEEVLSAKKSKLEFLTKGKLTCRICKIEKDLSSFGKDKDQIGEYDHRCKSCTAHRGKIFRNKNKEKIAAYHKARRSSPQGREKLKIYWRNKRATDPTYRLSNNISRQLRRGMKLRKLNKHWESIVGYSVEELASHVEKQFKIGMTWENYGQWHIDHIRPICSFNFKNIEDPEVKNCWALSNLRPLWAKENQSKGGKYQSSQSIIASIPQLAPTAVSAAVETATA